MLAESEIKTLAGLILSRANEGEYSGGAVGPMGFSGEPIEQACRRTARIIGYENGIPLSLKADLVFRNDWELDIENHEWIGMLGLRRESGYYG